MKRFRSSRDGYVLLTTLLIIAISAVLSAGLVRQSLNMASSALRAERELQSKWGVVSCKRFAISQRAQLLTGSRIEGEETVNVPLFRSDVTLTLGDQTFFVLLQDESAKLNINHSYEHAGRAKTLSLVRQLSGSALPVQLRQLGSRNRTAIDNNFESWAQVFVMDGDRRLPADQMIAATESLTCWGQGINLELASDEVLQKTAAPLVGATMAARLLKIRREGNLDDWQQLLSAAGARETGIDDLAKIVRTSSSAYSIWIVNSSSHRTSTSFSVVENVTSSVTRISSF